jgi:uncharacterized protein YdeI (YjbR/CyaY-like superfamily)
MNKKNPQVDRYVRKNKNWQKELDTLRKIILTTPLTEEVKWRVPCYTFEEHNVVFLGAFKEWCGLSFVKGVLLKDAKRILKAPGPNSQSTRLVRFTDVRKIVAMGSTLKAYIREAIAVEKAGVKVKLKKITEHKIPEELQKKLDESSVLEKAFRALSPGRQRAYMLYFSGAKQAKTREARVEKHLKRILSGKGLDD